MRFSRIWAFTVLFLLVAAQGTPAVAYTGEVKNAPAIALHGEPKYGPGFTHLDYVNPDAPKGGELHLAALGTFDTLNSWILKGQPATGSGLVAETLMAQTEDEPFSEYGLIAESISIPADQSWVEFTLRPQARWHDGKPVTVEDVLWTFETLKAHGHPFYRSYYRDVKSAGKKGERKVRFLFTRPGNRELPLIVGQMPVLAKHWWTAKGRDFSKTTLETPLGSGPYRVERVEPGHGIVYRKVADWWGKDLPINRGRYNFDSIIYDYYRDTTVALEAFLAGRYDFRLENVAKNWALSYDTPAVREGRIVRQEIPSGLPAGMQAFVMNTRREIFKDPEVREAIALAFDFEWGNKNVAFGAYSRTRSFFENSDLAARGLPAAAELALLEPWKDKVPPEVFTQEYQPPVSDSSGQDRALLRRARELLEQAGWTLKDGVLVNGKTGQPFRFEIVDEQDMFDRWTQPFLKNLKRLGIAATFRVVDSAQYQNIMDRFDFDMTVAVFGQSLSPGNEQTDFWGSSRADMEGSRNIIGVKDPAVDALIEKIITAPDREALVAATRALDRVLLWNHYVIPQWYSGKFRIAFRNTLGHPQTSPPYGLPVADTWWVKTAQGKQ
ncbi:MAG: extracellular solute-binding protein [Pseudomonadota bacterium]|nr:extracellular solute-binding protein [Pseudomonadota bacterium]